MSPLVILAAGGTGGHIFPAEALAECLLARGMRLGFVTDRRGHAYGGTLGRIETFRVAAAGVSGKGPLAKAKAAAQLGLGILQSVMLLRRLGPAVVVGFGGYASAPAMLAASFLGLPTLLHEQNAVLGRANRLLAGRARAIATSFAQVEHVDARQKPRLTHTGMPVRAAIAVLRDTPYPPLDDTGRVRLLVLGGSQGARALSEVVPAALAHLPEAMRRRIVISQQCRPEDVDFVSRAYEGTGIDATLDSFFADVPERMAAAHLVIARSGASTVAELTAMGRPSILVPYPFATDDHQTANAHAIEECGGAWLMPQAAFTPEALAARLEALFAQPGTLARTAGCARASGRADAALRLAELVTSLIPAAKEPTP